jgi:hypothetical protein
MWNFYVYAAVGTLIKYFDDMHGVTIRTMICITNLGEMTCHYENTTISRRDGLHHPAFIRSMSRIFTFSLSDNVDFFQNPITILRQNQFLYQIQIL